MDSFPKRRYSDFRIRRENTNDDVDPQENPMNTVEDKRPGQNAPHDTTALTGARSRTLRAIFRHPTAHNLEWDDVVSLFGKIGGVEHRANDEYAFDLGGKRHVMRRPHGKDLASSEVSTLRVFLSDAGWSVDGGPLVPEQALPTTRNLLVVVDHHDARLYRIDAKSDSEADVDKIEPYDPHHFLHHLTHRDQAGEKGQRAPEDSGFYEQIAQALKPAAHIVIVGHGSGKSNAAHHLMDHLRAHESEIYQRVADEVTTDLSSITEPQLLELALSALQKNAGAI